VIQGSHPEGVEASVLEHILGTHLTIPSDKGIFLPVTWRLSPAVCAFTSELFYESRLEPKKNLENQALVGVERLSGSGLWYLDMEHDGCTSSSDAEVEVVARLVERLTAPGSLWMKQDKSTAQLTLDDVLVVSPFNAQVSRLIDRLPTGARVGTVDKFQGQEAPVVIYSMATSSAEDAPRGMEFLYSLNRLNVATSRARCAVIVVANARLFEPECRSPRQMKLANAMCRYRELGIVVPTRA
jgi:superfamily I DNA and/or RNA helicase